MFYFINSLKLYKFLYSSSWQCIQVTKQTSNKTSDNDFKLSHYQQYIFQNTCTLNTYKVYKIKYFQHYLQVIIIISVFKSILKKVNFFYSKNNHKRLTKNAHLI